MTPSRPVHSAYHDVFGHVIRVLRGERGLSQEALGRRARLHRNYVGALERGEVNPSLRVLLKVERGLQVPLAAIFKRAAEYARANPRFPTPTDSGTRDPATEGR